MNKKQLLGLFFRSKRIMAGLTQKEVSNRAGISYNYYNDLERGNKGLARDERIKRICEVIGCDFREALSVIGKKSPDQELSEILSGGSLNV